MRVRVYAPGYIDHAALNPDGFIELAEGATVSQLLKKLKVPLPLRAITGVSVNYQQVPASTRLEDGDTVTFLVPLPGG